MPTKINSFGLIGTATFIGNTYQDDLNVAADLIDIVGEGEATWPVRLDLARIFVSKGRFDRAKSLIDTLSHSKNLASLSCDQIFELVDLMALIGDFKKAELFSEQAYSSYPNMMGLLSNIGWQYCLRSDFTNAFRLFESDHEKSRLPHDMLWKYAVLCTYHDRVIEAEMILGQIEALQDKVEYCKFMTRIYNCKQLDSHKLDLSIKTLDDILEMDSANSDAAENLVLQYLYTEQEESIRVFLHRWENTVSNNLFYVPRITLSTALIRRNDFATAKRMIDGVTLADVQSNLRMLMTYIQTIVMLEMNAALKEALHRLFRRYPNCFLDFPSWCLMFSLVAYKFKNEQMFKRCIELGQQYSASFVPRYELIKSLLNNIQQESWNIPPFPLPKLNVDQ